MPSTVKKRSVVVASHRTSISLEIAFWDSLRDLAQAQGKTINQLVSEIDSGRTGNLSSAIRVYVLAAAREGRLAPKPAPGAAPETVPEAASATSALSGEAESLRREDNALNQ